MCELRQTTHGPAVAAKLGNDPFTPVTFTARTPEAIHLPAGDFVIELEHFDEGAGLIGLAWRRAGEGAWRAPGRQTAYARLNTGKVRTAWFGFNCAEGAEGALEFQITGVPLVRALRLLPAQTERAWQKKRDAIPRDVKPMVTLKRPMELVTTAGIDVAGGYEALEPSVERIRELAPLARVLGFTSIEGYVTWKRIEPKREGEFDFSFYDGVVSALKEYHLKWFPLLIVGSAYALPDWFAESAENIGMVCLEHGMGNPIQSIAAPSHKRHVTRVLQAFGKHYEPMGVLEGVRLGPSGNYGESQYPAGGNWSRKNEEMHIHIGWWAGDVYAVTAYRDWLSQRYADIGSLNAAWKTKYPSLNEVPVILPEAMLTPRQRYDFTAWYTGAMSEWCAWWAGEARKAMPRTPIYQSAGGWGFREAGTDYAAQTKAMRAVGGGIRLTNETDSYEQNYYVTRLAATAARLYKTPLGYEPASSHTARGVAGRIYECAAEDGGHFFTYHANVFNHPLAIRKWIENLPVLDTRCEPVVDVAVYYPETANQLDDGTFRNLYASGFYNRAAAIRRVLDVDYLDEKLILDGFLVRYKVLIWVWGNVIDDHTQAAIDAWMKQGGTLIYPSFPKPPLATVDGDDKVFRHWNLGKTGKGRFVRFKGDMEPPSLYAAFAKGVLLDTPQLAPQTQAVLRAEHPDMVFLTVQSDGHVLALNYGDSPAELKLAGHFDTAIPPYGILRLPLDAAGTAP